MRDAPVVVDDVASAARHLTELGRQVVGPASERVRSTVVQFAAANRWHVVAHGEFAAWLRSRDAQRTSWLLLDPLLDDSHMPSARKVRVSRTLHGTEWRIEAPQLPSFAAQTGVETGLVDDAAASGSTLLAVANCLPSVGAALIRIAICSGSALARSAILARWPSVKWEQFVEGNRRTIHLRDACPYFPFSGRPSAAQLPIQVPSGEIQIRVPSLARKVGLWAQVFADYRVLAATVSARSEVVTRFSSALGRDATVGDLPLLGRHLPLPAFPRHSVTAETTLSSLC